MILVPAALAAALVVSPGCDVSDATLDWGVKESFRAYIDGSIANGEWTTTGDVSYATPEFTWTGGTGRYDPRTGEGSIAFSGSVRFVGHDGVLDTTISDPVVRFEGDSGVLLLDVSGPTMDGGEVDVTGVEFVALSALEIGGEDAIVTVDAQSVLTEDGAAAFPNYAAGEPFDPVTVELTVGDTCAGQVPAMTDAPGADDGDDEPAAQQDSGWGWWALGGAALALLLTASIGWIVRRRNARA